MRWFFVLLLCSSCVFAVADCPGGRGARKLDYFVGGSMLPVIHPGDDVYYRVARRAEVGDVVVMRYKNTDFDIRLSAPGGGRPTWLVHRLVTYAHNDGYILKGDHNALRDPVVFPRSNLVGVVCFVRHNYRG